jgi:hypothetical protein
MANGSAAMASEIPVLPPVPAGREPFLRARGLAALIATLDDAVISHRGPAGDAIVVIVGGRVLDAISVPAGRPPLIGLEALNALGPADSSNLRASTLDRRLALALPSYWREQDRLPPIAARWVDPVGLVESIVRRGRRGVALLRSSSDLGLAFFDESGLVAAYSEARPEPGGLEVLAPLMADADTIVQARIADPSSQPRHAEGPDIVAALPDPIERCRGEILDLARSRLHLHAEPVTARFQSAPGTTNGLLLAAEEVRGLRPRLVNPATLTAIAERAEEIVRAVARGA